MSWVQITITIFGTCLTLMLAWILHRWWIVNQYEKQVRKHLLKMQCPLFNIDIMMNCFKQNKPAGTCARLMQDRWLDLKDANKGRD